MTPKRRTRFVNAPLIAVLSLLVMPLLYAGEAGATYFIDGSVGTGPLSYDNPNDGQCVVGIRMNAGNAEFLVDKNITNYRDCVSYTTNLTAMTTQATCAPAASGSTLGTGTSGWRHSWATGVCVSGANGVSRVDLDNTAAMCTSKGGTIGNACVAYGWLYRGIDPVTGAAPPFTGSPAAAPFDTSNYTVWHGVDSTTGNGFCYTAMDFTAVPSGGYTRPLSTSWPDPGNPNACPMFDPNNATGRARTGTTWSDYVWNWKSNPEIGAVPPTTGTICRNAYGVKGKLVTAITASVAGNAYTVGPKYDLQAFTDQAKCVANGFSWEPSVRTTGFVDATVRGVMSATPCGSATDCYAGVDITTPGNAGGGKFVSRQCLKCHSDQSRGFIELDKPGFVETPHKHAGDSSDPVIAGIGDNAPWQLKGIQCSICHAASNPQQTDVINKNNSGAFIQTSAHENATAGAGVTQVCYHCHSDATLGVSANTTPAAVIPVSGGDFAENGQHLAPIVNEFLNSPHAQYSGTNAGDQLRNHANYASGFIGYNCKTAGSVPATQSAPDAPGGTVAWTATNCPAAGHKWATAPTTGTASAACYFTATSCAAAGGTWNATYDKLNYPFGGTGNELCTASKVPWSCCTGAGTGTCVNIGDNAACTASGSPMSCCTGLGTGTCSTGVCSGIGLGSSTTTVYQSGVAEKIGFPDSTTNTNCTNPGDGSATSGAVAYWVKEGKDAYTAQGSCMTCHDVHWDFGSTNPEAEPFRRECTTCHENSGTSASGAPQIDLVTINHLKTTGTPLENWLTDPDGACETCHMPKSGGEESSTSPMHLWRISTNSTYTTMGATQVNTTPDGLAWVDIDHACGQCHGGGTVQDAEHMPDPLAPYRTKVALAAAAKGMHDAASVTYATTFTTVITGLKVDVTAQVNCGDGIVCPTFTYDWDWGDGASTLGAGKSSSHTYASYAAKSIVLKVRLGGKIAGSATRSVTPAPPTITFTATITGLKVDVVASASCGGSCPTFTYDWNWGDGTAHGSANPGTHTYATAGTKTVTLTLSEGGKILATTAKNVKPTNAVPDLPPTASATCTWDANTWIATVVDTSTDTDTSPVQTVTVDWGDLSARAVGGAGATLLHTYIAPPTSPATSYTLTLTAIDTALKASTPVTLTCTPSAVAPAYFTISGTVYAHNGTTPLPSASVTLKKGSSAIKTVYTAAGGTFSAGSLKPGTYTLTVTKPGYTFAVPAATITVGGPGSSGNNIVATGP
jgi:hypothetical protein